MVVIFKSVNTIVVTLQMVIILFQAGMTITFRSCPSRECTCLDNSLSPIVDCSNRNLDAIPRFRPSNRDTIYSSIDLSKNDIYFVNPQAFININTRAIMLSRNHLVGISPRGFMGLSDTLEKLDLYDTGLRVVHWGVFRELRALQELNLGKNGMFAVPVGLFDKLQMLQDLSLAANELTNIPAGLFRNLHNLGSLDFEGNRISDIEPDAFEKLRKLHTLNLNNNQLTDLDDDSKVQGLDKLQNLYLERNRFAEIPTSTFGQLPRLRKFSISANFISRVPKNSFLGATDLNEINLSDNEIDFVSSDGFAGLYNLRKIYLVNNKIQTIGQQSGKHCYFGLSNIQRLQEVYLEENPLNCNCSMSWIRELHTKNVRVDGVCESPKYVAKKKLHEINVGPCDCERS